MSVFFGARLNSTSKETQNVATWTPDPTFYPSPKMAMDAPQEELAYVVIVNPKNDGRPDALGERQRRYVTVLLC